MAQYEVLDIDQGADVAFELQLVNKDGSKKDLNSYSVFATMRQYYGADSDLSENFNTNIESPDSDGIVTISLTDTQTSSLDATKRYVYDVFIDDSVSDRKKVLQGQVRVIPAVTT